ncbi:MAG: bifunctional [glutamine synthetase] adenylyltransferase/[glutamine synthetase]-adenylyl-L-tyrosine phosphorylase, partial [Hyphomicrobiales bacterium]|nr:bifunctional [glutamine synthetase] adenylyltransferase/[glutamine synthetase]-adenylyl-L-tyrosine phosphorylase [Hyphomicrobiales bacterium]
EFFVQTQQLIAGGRNPDLRGRRTLDMLDELTRQGWISAATSGEMAEAYTFLRCVEHRIQMVADEQTQTLPDDDEGLERIARLAGFADRTEFAAALTTRLERVQHHYGELFEEEPSLSSDLGSLVFTGDDDDPATLETLSQLGFRQPREVTRAVRAWHFGRYAATRSARARERLTEITPALLEALSHTAAPDAAFVAFDRFLGGLPTGVQLFSLLRSNPALLHLLANILGTAPRLAAIVTRHPRVLDGVLDPAFFGALPNETEFEERLDRLLAEADIYEDALDRARIFGQEQEFLIGARILSRAITANHAGAAFATLAGVLLDRLLAAVRRQLAEAHGEMPGGRAIVLALGKLGGREMTASSDLDLILLYDFDEGAIASDGARPLSGSQYYIRMTQRLVAALSAPTAEGTLYEVDFRLRPSGNAGPLATRIDAFERYQREDAWTWEHMVLTRARVVAGDSDLAARAEASIHDILTLPRDTDKIRDEVRSMRGRIEAEKGTDHVWDLKNVSGGLIDIEFVAQYLQLTNAAHSSEVLDVNTLGALTKASRSGMLPAADAEILIPAARLYHDLTQILRLCIDTRFDPDEATGEFKALLAEAGELPDFGTLQAHLAETQRRVRQSFERLIGEVAASADA